MNQNPKGCGTQEHLSALRVLHPPAGYSYHSRGAKYSADIEVGQGKSHFDRARRNPAPFDEPKHKGMRHPGVPQRLKGSPLAHPKNTRALNLHHPPVPPLTLAAANSLRDAALGFSHSTLLHGLL